MAIREVPIIFSAPMVEAILEGRKTQTRRVLHPQPNIILGQYPDGTIETNLIFRRGDQRIHPRYQVGDRLWVKETWNDDWCDHVIYKADGGSAKAAGYATEPKWKSGRFMFKKHARIWLEVTAVRAEQITSITTADAIAEGVIAPADCPSDGTWAPTLCFAELWDSIHGKTHPWSENCWVWAYTFKRIEARP